VTNVVLNIDCCLLPAVRSVQLCAGARSCDASLMIEC
jgi:hypothetical protein